METFYTAYCKQVDQTSYFFVKRFLRFPDLPDVAPVLENFGMHSNFDAACKIAHLTDAFIKQQLLEEIECQKQQAKVIDINKDVTIKRFAL